MQELITMILNNGIGVVCVAYLIYFQSTTMSKISENQEKNNQLMQMITDRLENIERKIEK